MRTVWQKQQQDKDIHTHRHTHKLKNNASFRDRLEKKKLVMFLEGETKKLIFKYKPEQTYM